MKKMKKVIALVLSLVMCMSILSSCGKSADDTSSTPPSSDQAKPSDSTSAVAQVDASAEAPPPEGAVYADFIDLILDNSPIPVVNPTAPVAASSCITWVYIMIYDTLVDRVGEGEYSPSLATSWETDDWKTITMKLRNDVTFHNGDKFTAADVVNTVNLGKESVGTPAFDRWIIVESVTADDDYTVTFVLEDVNVDFLYNISLAQAGILNARAMAEDPEKGSWIGTGAFYIAEFATNDYVKVSRNDNYWGKKAITKDINLRFVPEESTRLMMLQNGETDICFSINPNDLPMLEEDTENYVCYPVNHNNMHMLGFNMEDPLCSDYNFRMAVASALKRDEIALVADGKYGVPEVTGTFWGLSTEFRNNDIPIVPYDLEKAKEYLEASPYNGETIEIATALSTCILATEVVQEQLSLVGITTKINQMDPPGIGAYLRYGENKSQMFLFIGAAPLGAYAVRNLFYPGAASNRVSYNNPVVSEILDRVSSLADINERKAAYFELQEIIAEDPPAFNLFYHSTAAACVKGVGGMVLQPDQFYDLRYVYKVIG